MKRNSPTYPTIAMCLAGAASSVISLQSGAFQLGQIQGASRIDEPLSAYIDLIMSPRESQLETEIIVLPDFDYRYDAVMNDALSAITATLVRNEYGHHYIALSSSRKLNLPLISFRLEAKNGDNTLVQHFSLAPRPPLPVVVQQPKATLFSRRRNNSSSTVSQQLVKPSTSASNGEYGPVKAGDTLWKIATRVAGNDAGKVLNRIFELNPQAFINGDINKLKQGVVLKLPPIDSQTAPTVAEGLNLVATDNPISTAAPIVAGTPGELTSSIEEPSPIVDEESTLLGDSAFEENGAFGNEKIVAGELVDSGISTSGNTGEIALALTVADTQDWREANPELSKKLDSLGDKYAALRARFAAQSTDQSVASVSHESATAAEQTIVQAMDSTMPKAIAETNETSVDLAKVSSPDPTTVSTLSDSVLKEENLLAGSTNELSPSVSTNSKNLTSNSRFELPTWLLGVLGLMLAISAIGYIFYRLSVASRRKAEQVTRTEKDDSLKQELAKKAQHRIMMEGEVERMLGERLEDDGDEIEKTMQLHIGDVLPEQFDSEQLDSEQINVEQVDVSSAPEDSAQGRIDASISHGRYAEAEDLLREVIADSPRNFTAKLRLAEVYYITEKISDFVEISQDIHAHHRPEISDEDWRRVMRMGKMIAPEQPPFSGPQSILDDASAG